MALFKINWVYAKIYCWLSRYCLFYRGLFFLALRQYYAGIFLLALFSGGLYVGMTFNAGIGVLESYTERVSRIRGFEYGRARMWGSLGWASATFIAGHNINIDPNYNFLWHR